MYAKPSNELVVSIVQSTPQGQYPKIWKHSRQKKADLPLLPLSRASSAVSSCILHPITSAVLLCYLIKGAGNIIPVKADIGSFFLNFYMLCISAGKALGTLSSTRGHMTCHRFSSTLIFSHFSSTLSIDFVLLFCVSCKKT